MKFYLAPFTRATGQTPKGEPYTGAWEPPAGALGLMDLRAGGTGFGLFGTEGTITGGRLLGEGDTIGDVTLGAAQRTIWANSIGVPEPTGTLLDALWELLTVRADPTGQARVKPVMPTRARNNELWVGGRLARRVPLPESAGGHWPLIVAVLQASYREVEATASKGETAKARTLHRRWLGFQQEKYRLSTAQTRELIPRDMTVVDPLPPETTITDDFNRANADPVSNSAEGWAWAEVSGTAWVVASNQLQLNQQTTTLRSVRAESDLSGADHYSQNALASFTYEDFQHNSGACARFSSSAETFYGGGLFQATGPGAKAARIYKSEAGTLTQLATAAHTWNVGDVVKIECDGSTLRVYVQDVEITSATDMAISGGTRAGCYMVYRQGANQDDFEAADLEAAAAFLQPGNLMGGLIDELAGGVYQ